MEIALIAIYTALFCFIILKWKWFRDSVVNKYLFIFIFVMKVAAGIFAGELYLQRYNGGDSFIFFESSKVITQSFKTNPVDFFMMTTGLGDDEAFIEKYGKIIGWKNQDIVYNDNQTILRLNAVIGLFSFQYYNVHVVFFAFISMMGLMGIYKGIRLLTMQNPYLIFGSIFLIPGVIFWISLASKESILIFAMGMMFYHCMRLLTVSKSFGNILGMFLAGFLFIHIKAYLLIMITPCLLAYTWVSVTDDKRAVLKYFLVYLILGILFFNAKYFLNGFDPVDVVFMKRMNFEAFADAFPKDMGSYIRLPEFKTDWIYILSASPVAVFTVATRPFIWESESLLITFAAIENILLILVVVTGLIYYNGQSMRKNINLLMFCICFVITVYILIGITTPVMGAMVRYKVPVLPFLCIIPILISGPKIPEPTNAQVENKSADENEN